MLTQRDILRRVRQVEIKTRRLVTDALSGSYQSAFKGQGIDFEETREYVPGDDIRSIDWNVTAKMDRPFVKVFREERELTILLAVDVSASQRFGSSERSKRELAAEMAGVLAFSALRNNDKVGLLLFSDHIELYAPPRKGRQNLLRVVRDILFFEPKGRGSRRLEALEYINRVLKRRAVVFFLTDFTFEPFEWEQGLQGERPLSRAVSLTAARHDLICVDLTDPHELALPNVGLISLEDPETGEIVELDTGDKSVRQRYEKISRMRTDFWPRKVRESGVGFIQASTAGSFVEALQRFMSHREHSR